MCFFCLDRKLTNELSSYIRSSVVGNRPIRIGEQIIKSIEKYLNAIEENQNRWQSEIEIVAYTLKCISGYFQEKYFETTTKQLTDDINHLTDNKDKIKLDLQLQLRRSKSAEINIDQLQDCKVCYLHLFLCELFI